MKQQQSLFGPARRRGNRPRRKSECVFIPEEQTRLADEPDIPYGPITIYEAVRDDNGQTGIYYTTLPFGYRKKTHRKPKPLPQKDKRRKPEPELTFRKLVIVGTWQEADRIRNRLLDNLPLEQIIQPGYSGIGIPRMLVCLKHRAKAFRSTAIDIEDAWQRLFKQTAGDNPGPPRTTENEDQNGGNGTRQYRPEDCAPEDGGFLKGRTVNWNTGEIFG